MSCNIRFRSALPSDASALWRLVKNAGTLELNSSYFYLAFAQFFGDTCLVAEDTSKEKPQTLGGIIAFRAPADPKVLFVWQIGVLPEARGQGLAKRMLKALLQLPACTETEYLQATITKNNAASRGLFQSFARTMGADCNISSFFTADLFPTPHDEEELFSIGPLSSRPHHPISSPNLGEK